MIHSGKKTIVKNLAGTETVPSVAWLKLGIVSSYPLCVTAMSSIFPSSKSWVPMCWGLVERSNSSFPSITTWLAAAIINYEKKYFNGYAHHWPGLAHESSFKYRYLSYVIWFEKKPVATVRKKRQDVKQYHTVARLYVSLTSTSSGIRIGFRFSDSW